MKDILNSYIEDTIEILEHTESKLLESKIQSITIDEKYFNKKFMCKYFDEFEELKTRKKPILYWFELTSSENNITIREKYERYRKLTKDSNSKIKYRNTSSVKTKPDYNSKFLYVGKVEKGFWGRLVTHLGYNVSEKTAGMQLFHWYNPTLYGNIQLNYIEFDSEMKHLIIILEKKLAKELKPLIGRW